MAIVLRTESVWRDEAGESEMMEVGGSGSGRRSPRNLMVRPSFVDAFVAYTQVSKGKARGKKKTLWLRLVMQKYLSQLGNFIQIHCGKIVFVGLVALFMSCLGLKTYQMESDINKLWIDAGSRMAREMKYTVNALGMDDGEINEAVVQVSEDEGQNVLTVESLLLHLDVLKEVVSVNMHMLDIPWTFRDVCYMLPFNYIDLSKFSDNYLDQGDTSKKFGQVLEDLMPCFIVSPLECFWEGSKLVAYKSVSIPGYGEVDWTNLDPQDAVDKLSQFSPSMANNIRELMDKAGISTGYQEKPCLDPHDPACPETAPNFSSKEPPDVASVLAQGCDGFAKNYMHFSEDMMLGGIQRNKSGHIVRSQALQSTIMLVGEKMLFNMFKDNPPTLPWNDSVAGEVIRAWEKQMTKVVDKFVTSRGGHQDYRPGRSKQSRSRDKVHSFTSSNMVEMLAEYSQVSYLRIALGFLLMGCYAIVTMVNVKKFAESQAAVALAGLLLLVLSSTAGLGLCSVLHLTFNAITTQVVPFLVVGLGMDHVFLILHTFTQLSSDGVPYKDRTGACLKRVGGLILVSTVCNSSAFLLASVIPVPATRFFCFQCSLLILVNGTSTLLLFPAMVSIDLLRRKSGRMDFFCCQLRPPTTTTTAAGSTSSVSYIKSKKSKRTSDSPKSPHHPHHHPPHHHHHHHHRHHRWTSHEEDDDDDGGDEFSTFSFKSKSKNNPDLPERGSFGQNSGGEDCFGRSSGISSLASSHELLSSSSSSVYLPSTVRTDSTAADRRSCCSAFVDCVLSEFVRRFYAPLLEKLPVKIIVVIFFIISIVVGIVGVLRVREGLDTMDVMPASSPEREFFRIQSKYFGFYYFHIATQENFDYASEYGQKLLHSFHHSFESIDNIIRSKDGSFPEFWLEVFRKWLLEVQEAFDADVQSKSITIEGWHPNSTNLGSLGYKLMVQTGIKSSPIDRNRTRTGRLVNSNGIIYPPAFYNYLTAWSKNDIAYDFSQAHIKPFPEPWAHEKTDPSCNIPPSHPITYAQSAFILNGLHSDEKIMEVLSDVRNICDSFVSRGLPNYPHGLLVTFWEQFFSVRFYLFILVASVLAVVFVVVLTVLLNPFAAFLEVFVLVCTMVELYGFMGLAGVKMSSLSAVLLIVSVGTTVHVTVPFVLAFQTCIGPRDRRMVLSLEQAVTPSIHTFVAAFLGLLVLAATELVFIRKYIFGPFVVMLMLGCLNGLVFLPVLLSLVGPSAEVTPLNDGLYLPPPSPVIQPQKPTTSSRSRLGQKATYKTRKKSRNGRSRSRSRISTRLKNPPNLSTIVEESSNSCASSISIDLKPTIIISNPPHCCSGGASSSQSVTPSTAPSTGVVDHLEDRESSAHSGRKLQVFPSSYHLHSSLGSTLVTSSPVQVSSCSSSHCTTVETTTKVKVHICDQKDRVPKQRLTSKQRSTGRRDMANVNQLSEKYKRTHH